MVTMRIYQLKINGFLRGKCILNKIASMKKHIAEISEVILQELLEYKKIYSDFTFALRERDSVLSKEKRLEKGFWFQGSDYIFVPLFSKGDDDRKIKSIGFVITLDQNNAIKKNYIEVSFKGKNFNNDEVNFHKEVAEALGIKLNQDNFGYYFFEYQDNYIDNLKFYISEFRSQVITLLEKYNLTERYIISENKFQKSLDKIKKIKKHISSSANRNQMENINVDKKTPLNQILFGAPGTGKTYNTKRIAVEIINGKKQRTREEINAEYEDLVNAKQIVFTTFHQSLSYEDFIEGIKPVMDENEDGAKTIAYEVREGIFKELCKNANKNISNKTVDNFDEVWNKLIEEVKNKIADNKLLKIGSWEYGLSSKDSLKYSSVDSPSQYTFTITKQNILDTYQNKQARPSGAFQKDMKDIVGYMKTHFGLKTNKEDKGTLQSNVPYVLIIDEINRGNVSAIFGELITLLEEDKRKGNKEQTEVILPYSNEKFSVPNNVYLIGTMNTADRSVEALDTALRRRFSFVEMQPKPEILLDSEYKDVDLKQLLETINQRIEVLVDKDHQIGHSYFIGIQDLEDLKLVFKDKIIPLLEEYFYGDFGKIGLVLGASFIFQEENTAKFPKNFPYENYFLEDKKVYRFTLFENWKEQTFISVYKED